MYNGPPRPGARGGRGEFSWDKVVQDKDREYYLGHSVKALAGRWQKGRDVYWYTRNKDGGNTLQDEIRAVKEREEQLMMEALGLKPKSAPVVHQPMDAKELAAVLKKNAPEQEEQAAGDKEDAATGMKGLGFAAGLAKAPSGAAEHVMELGGTLQGEGTLPPPPPLPQHALRDRPAADISRPVARQLPGPPGGGGAMLLQMLASGMQLTSAQLKELAKHDKKAAKRAKKEAKQARKEAKKAKKQAKDKDRKPHGEGLQPSKRPRRESDSEDDGMQHKHRHHDLYGQRHGDTHSRGDALRSQQHGQRGDGGGYGYGYGDGRGPRDGRDGREYQERRAGVDHRYDADQGRGRREEQQERASRHEQYHVPHNADDGFTRTNGRDDRVASQHQHGSYDIERRHDRGIRARSPHSRQDRHGHRPEGREAEHHHRGHSRSRSRSKEHHEQSRERHAARGRSQSPAGRHRDRSPHGHHHSSTFREHHQERGMRADRAQGSRELQGRGTGAANRGDARTTGGNPRLQAGHDAVHKRSRSRSVSRSRSHSSRSRSRSSGSSSSSSMSGRS